MSAPVISNPTNTSVLGWRQWQTWEFQPYATHFPTRWDCVGLPPGISIDSTTGLISGFATLPGVWNCPLRAYGPWLTISSNSTSSSSVVTTSAAHGLMAGDTVIIESSNSVPSIDGEWTVTVIDGTTFSVPVNVSGGTAGTAGQVAKASAPLIITIGIEAAAFQPNICPVLNIDLDSGHVVSDDGRRSSADSATAPMFWAKRGDVFPVIVRFFQGDVYVAPALTALKFGLRAEDSEALTVIGGGPTGDTDFKKFGEDDTAYWVMFLDFSGDALAADVAENEGGPDGTGDTNWYYGLAEIEWQTGTVFGFGPDPNIRTSRTFVVGSESDLIPN